MVSMPAMLRGLAPEQTLVRSDGEAALDRSRSPRSECNS
jgi:hypothetical protein